MLRRTEASASARQELNRWGLLETAVLCLYAVTVALGLAWHEAWADEAQAWLLARDMGWRQMIWHGVRYEGTPGLWHSLLWVLVRWHVSFTAMHWIGACFSAAAVAVLLRYAPFPRFLRLLLPFTFFLAYQDAVVARSYVLYALAAFGIAALLARKRQKPFATAVVTGLLANISLHGLVLAVGLLMVAVVRWRRSGISRRAIFSAATIAVLFCAFATATVLPPPDVDFPAGRNIEHSWLKLLGSKSPSAQDPVRPGELAPAAAVPAVHRDLGIIRKSARILSLITYPLSTFRVLGLFAFLSLLYLAAGTAPGNGSRLWPLLPYALLLLVFQSVYLAPRHAGTLFIAFLVSAWLLWPRGVEPRRYTLPLSLALALVCVEQIGWTSHAVWMDVHHPYSGSPMTAEFLATRLAGHRVAGFYYHSVGTLPYFSKNIFENQPGHAYWVWSTSNRIDQRAPFELTHHPDYVVVSGWNWGNNADITVDWLAPADNAELNSASGSEPVVTLADTYRIRAFFLKHGYHETHRFCGRTWIRFGYAEELCDVILEPTKR